MTPELYPPAPTDVPADLTRPSGRYKRQAAAAVLGVVAFFLVYFGATFWLGLVAYRSFAHFGVNGARGLFVGIPAAFLCLVMVKGLFARRKMSRDGLLEITASDEPELFAFIHRVADDTGAPRPRRVYLSADVNAAVFLDVGLINLLIPSKKNLILGLGLVNSLTLDELKAVVAHEFGHFAQRSMGIGQWVYLAQGFVADLVARRDFLDSIIRGLSRTDFRIAWIGWGMRILVWALRSMVDQLFRFVVLLSRALTRQMEFQADLVAVRVSGSDSLIHALHRLGAADRAWGEAANFVVGQARRGRTTADLFAVQSRFLERYREVHALPDHGATPERPNIEAASHRVFAHGIADAPKMWSTHPSNRERERSAKAQYFPSHLDARPAWSVFHDPDLAKRRMTAHFIDLATRPGPDAPAPAQPAPERVEVPLEETLNAVDTIFARAALDRRYQGLYTTFPMTRALGRTDALHRAPEGPVDAAAARQALDALFDAQVSEAVEEFFQLDEELAQLRGLEAGFLDAAGGVIRHRGRELKRKELAAVVAETKAELDRHRQALADRFLRARGLALEVARLLDEKRDAEVGPGPTTWAQHLEGMAHLLRYAEHTQANLVDMVDFFQHVLAIVFADGNVSQAEMQRLVAEGAELSYTMRRIFEQREALVLPEPVRQRLTKDGVSWAEVIGPQLHLSAPTPQDFANDWIGIASSWWNPYMSSLGALGTSTLDVLLETEEYLVACLRDGRDPGPAPAAAQVPSIDRDFPFGNERERQKRLGWWDRFQTAEGIGGGTMRFAVAAAILTPAFFAGFTTSQTDLWIHNGLQRSVEVQVGEETFRIFGGDHITSEMDADDTTITTRTLEGEVIESFEVDLDDYDQPVYSVAGAASFARWWAVYGNLPEMDMEFENERVFDADADYVFQQPPEQISSRHATRKSVLEPLEPGALRQLLGDAEVTRQARVHQQWDPDDAPSLSFWLMGLPEAEREPAMRARFERAPSGRTWLIWSRMASPEAVEARCANAAPPFVAAVCSKDAASIARAANGDPWLHLLAGDAAVRAGDPAGALEHYRSASVPLVQQSPEAGLDIRMAIALRLLGRYAEAAALPTVEGTAFAYFNAIEQGISDSPIPSVRLADARRRGEYSSSVFELQRAQPTGDDLALAVASEGAPEEWIRSLREDTRPLENDIAALSVWALGERLGDEGLKQRGAQAYQRLEGPLDLGELNLEAHLADPAALAAHEDAERVPMSARAQLRMAALIARRGEVPAEWRHLAHAVLFLAERPMIQPAPEAAAAFGQPPK
ncbi:MAG: hypothetical protein CMN30_06285 [Sandaracinus sp.]|nr:hypothetical protein [Sandaracinus sp.]